MFLERFLRFKSLVSSTVTFKIIHLGSKPHQTSAVRRKKKSTNCFKTTIKKTYLNIGNISIKYIFFLIYVYMYNIIHIYYVYMYNVYTNKNVSNLFFCISQNIAVLLRIENYINKLLIFTLE